MTRQAANACSPNCTATSPENLRTQAQLDMRWDSVRLSLAGGEPLLYPDAVIRIASQARSMGFKISLITNGSYLNSSLMGELAPLLSVLGLSLDSGNAKINRQHRSRRPQIAGIAARRPGLHDQGRAQADPAMRLKINTVVNALNFADDLGDTIRAFGPDKWKVLRVLPVIGDELAVTDPEFSAFSGSPSIASIDHFSGKQQRHGRVVHHDRPARPFLQNALDGQRYRYSAPINAAGADTAFRQIRWQAAKFLSRYASNPERLAA